MDFNDITCDYIDCDSYNASSWNWVTASNGLDDVNFCSQEHHDIWMVKNAGNFWPNYNFMHGDLSEPQKQNKIDKPGEYRCKLSPYITDENKDSVIQTVMQQFQTFGMNPNIVAPQGEKYFMVTLEKGAMEPHEVKQHLNANYFIDQVSTPTDAKVKRNYRMNIPSRVQSSTNDITSHVMSLTKANDRSLANYEKVEWIPLEDAHKIREFDRLTPEHDTGRSRSTVDGIKKSLLEEGFRSPLNVDYNINDRYAYLGEGNHRLIAAQELGITHVPVTVHRSGEYSKHGNKGRGNAKQVPGVDPDQHGYVMGQMTPTQIGLTHPSNVRTSSVRQAIPYHVSPSENRDSIEEHGLLPVTEESNKWHSGIEPAVYMSKHPDYSDMWASEIADARHRQNIYLDEDSGYDELTDSEYNDLLERHEEHPFDLYHVNTEGLPTETRETDMGAPEIISKDHITPERIKHIKQFWASVNGQGYDAPVDSNLHAETDQDPQYIINQADITDPQRTASKSYEDENTHHAIANYFKQKYNWDENDRFGKEYSDYSSSDTKKNLSLLHGFTSDAWGDECTCPLCSFARNVEPGKCSSCNSTYDQSNGDRLFLIRPGTNILKKNVWSYNPDANVYTCPSCITKQKTGSKNISWYDE